MSWANRTWGLWSHPWQFGFPDGTSWPPSLSLTCSPWGTTLCKPVPASVAFTCPHLGTWKGHFEAQGGHPGLSPCSEAKGWWLPSLSAQPPSQFMQCEAVSALPGWGAYSFPPKVLTATSSFTFHVLCCKFLFLPPACRRFSAPKTSRQPGFQCSFNEKPAWKSLRPAGHRMANKHTWISLPALFFLLGYI